jgi:hypothetical protein
VTTNCVPPSPLPAAVPASPPTGPPAAIVLAAAPCG